MRWIALLLAFAAGLAAGGADASRGTVAPALPTAGVLVDQTRGTDARALAAARTDVARLRASGVAAELRVASSPSRALGAATTMVARGADRLIVRGAGDPAALAPLAERVPIVRR